MIRKKAVNIETASQVRELGKMRNVIVTVEPSGLIGFRLKQCRTTYFLTAAGCFQRAVTIEVESKRKARKTKTKTEY